MVAISKVDSSHRYELHESWHYYPIKFSVQVLIAHVVVTSASLCGTYG